MTIISEKEWFTPDDIGSLVSVSYWDIAPKSWLSDMVGTLQSYGGDGKRQWFTFVGDDSSSVFNYNVMDSFIKIKVYA